MLFTYAEFFVATLWQAQRVWLHLRNSYEEAGPGRQESPRWLHGPQSMENPDRLLCVPGEEQLNALQSQFLFELLFLFLFLWSDTFLLLLNDWFHLIYIYIYTVYIPHTVCVWYIYSIYSKTEDQTLAGKRNSYHFRMKLLFYCIWALAPRFLKALTMCLLYLPKSKAYFPAEVLPTCTLPCHIPAEEIRWAASYIAVNEKKKNLTLNEGLLTSRFSFVSFMPESSLNAESLLCWCMTRLEKPNKWKCEVNLRAICNLVLQRKLHCLIREVFFSVNNRTPVKQWLLIKWWLK